MQVKRTGGPASFKMSTAHEILCKPSLEGDHSTPSSTHGSVKAHTHSDADRNAPNMVTVAETKGMDEVSIVSISTNRSNAQRQGIAFACREGATRNLHQH